MTDQIHEGLPVLGILGAGKVGTGLARQALKAGYQVLISGSGDPAKISLIIQIMAPGAEAVSPEELMERADLIALSVPLNKFRTLNAEALAGKDVIDTMNYWRDTNGDMPELEAAPSSSELVASHLPESRVSKALNHIGYHELELDARPAGTADRRALAYATDHAGIRELTRELIERLGFDAVDAGPLANGIALETDTPIFTSSYDRAGLEEQLESFKALAEAA